MKPPDTSFLAQRSDRIKANKAYLPPRTVHAPFPVLAFALLLAFCCTGLVGCTVHNESSGDVGDTTSQDASDNLSVDTDDASSPDRVDTSTQIDATPTPEAVDNHTDSVTVHTMYGFSFSAPSGWTAEEFSGEDGEGIHLLEDGAFRFRCELGEAFRAEAAPELDVTPVEIAGRSGHWYLEESDGDAQKMTSLFLDLVDLIDGPRWIGFQFQCPTDQWDSYSEQFRQIIASLQFSVLPEKNQQVIYQDAVFQLSLKQPEKWKCQGLYDYGQENPAWGLRLVHDSGVETMEIYRQLDALEQVPIDSEELLRVPAANGMTWYVFRDASGENNTLAILHFYLIDEETDQISPIAGYAQMDPAVLQERLGTVQRVLESVRYTMQTPE